MRNIILLIFILMFLVNPIYGVGISSYFDKGVIYTGSSFPVSVMNDSNNEKPDIQYLKEGESVTYNILGLVETGDRGIQNAAKNGGITRIHYIDTSVEKVYIPLLFIPIYVKQIKTIVYGK